MEPRILRRAPEVGQSTTARQLPYLQRRNQLGGLKKGKLRDLVDNSGDLRVDSGIGRVEATSRECGERGEGGGAGGTGQAGAASGRERHLEGRFYWAFV
jgi:hypothetical protein